MTRRMSPILSGLSMMVKHSSHSICASTKAEKALPAGNPVCEARLAMHKDGKISNNSRTRQKYCCRSVNPKPERVLATTGTGTMAKETAATPSTESLPQTTDSTLTATVCISREHTLCVQSASDTMIASNPRVGNGCGYETVQAQRTSIRFLISLLLPSP